mmetsp:Transcript_22435/g.51394  ORF Transcript_22435/g.51394 Transcript_22435/m.51394 type:complete len:343 (-) Transcript_22435:37-1065(-)
MTRKMWERSTFLRKMWRWQPDTVIRGQRTRLLELSAVLSPFTKGRNAFEKNVPFFFGDQDDDEVDDDNYRETDVVNVNSTDFLVPAPDPASRQSTNHITSLAAVAPSPATSAATSQSSKSGRFFPFSLKRSSMSPSSSTPPPRAAYADASLALLSLSARTIDVATLSTLFRWTGDEKNNDENDIHGHSRCSKGEPRCRPRISGRLPKDNVRLVLASDTRSSDGQCLEPGVLSVVIPEKSSRNDHISRIITDKRNGNFTGEHDAHLPCHPPPSPSLRYVLTVPDDLYRRIVVELDQYRNSHAFGFYFCCHETWGRHVDIRVAVAILAILFLAMGISSIIWPFS